MKKTLTLLFHFMKGVKTLYIASIFATLIAVTVAFIAPLVIQVAIDSVIGSKPLNLPEIGQQFFNYLGGRESLAQKLWIFSLLFLALTLIRSFFIYLKGKWSAKASEQITKNIRETLYKHIQALPFKSYNKLETGDLIQRSTSDVETIRFFLSTQIVELGRLTFLLTASISMMLYIHVPMALISIFSIPLVLVLSFTFFGKVQKTFKSSDESEAKLSSILQENLIGVRVVRAFARQNHEMERFDEYNQRYRDFLKKLFQLQAYFYSISDILSMLQVAITLVLGVYFITIDAITLGNLTVFLIYLRMILWPVKQLGRLIADFGKYSVALSRIKEVLDEEKEEEKSDEIEPEITGDIVFNKVCFSYHLDAKSRNDSDIKNINKPKEQKKQYALSNISFSVKKGETIGIMGSTGSGKSTLISLLSRLYDYDAGSITINGKELNKIKRSWIRKHIGIALQDSFLFSKTIKDNIAITMNEEQSSSLDTQIESVAQIASIHESIQAFKEQYNTLVGERGITLSGGQRQRLAIARAILPELPIYIFDDSLSAVDTETDLNIRKALEHTHKEATKFIISHRASTLMKADKILVLDAGEIKETGTHDTLLKQEGLYAKIWHLQNNIDYH